MHALPMQEEEGSTVEVIMENVLLIQLIFTCREIGYWLITSVHCRMAQQLA